MPSIIATAALGLGAVGTVTAMSGQAMQAKAASQAANYNAQVQQRNSETAIQNAKLAGEAGEAQVAMSELKSRAQMGSIRANQGASGVDVGSESSTNVRESSRQLGQLDALTIRGNAVKEAYGYQVQSQGYQAQSSLDKAEAANDLTAGKYQVASTLLNGASQSGSQWASFKSAGAL